MTESRRPATQRDVARLAGVSQATVSYALASVVGGAVAGPPIAADTRRRVLAAAEQLGYRPDIAAQRMRGRNSRILGVHTYGDLFPISGGNYNHEYLLGIQAAAEESGYDLLMFTSTTHRRSSPSAFDGANNRLAAADGAVIMGFREDHDELLRLVDEGYPFVRIGRRDAVGGPTSGWVDCDYTAATADLIAELTRSGYQGLAYVGVARRSAEPWRARRDGVGEALRRGYVDEMPVIEMDREAITSGWLAGFMDDGYRTIVSENHHIAQRISEAATDLGTRIGSDLAVAVLQAPIRDLMENGYIGHLLEPRFEIGRSAGSLLIDLIEGRAAAEPGRLVDAPVCVSKRVVQRRGNR